MTVERQVYSRGEEGSWYGGDVMRCAAMRCEGPGEKAGSKVRCHCKLLGQTSKLDSWTDRLHDGPG